MLIDRNTFDPSKIKNRYAVVSSYNGNKSRINARPVELILEITNHCNLVCIMCPRGTMTRPKGYMDIELFKSIVDQLKDHLELLYLSGGLGEPLMHPRLGEMIAYCRAKNVRVGVSTNATILTPEKTEQLLSLPPNLILLSLDGATREVHESIRVGSCFEKTMGNVEHFLREKGNRGMNEPYTIVQMVYMPENESEAGAFHAKWRGFKAADDIRLKKFLHLQGAGRFPEEKEKLEESRCLSCILPWRQLSIAWDGTMALCCRDLDFRYPIGSVSSQAISDLWNSAAMVEYREMLASGKRADIPPCKNCLTIRTTALTRFGAVILDDFTIRKLLPIIEKIVLKAGIKLMDYE